jgi:hypothetical protein
VNIKAEIHDVDLVNAKGDVIESTSATCTRCGNEEDSYGTSAGSIARCLMLLRESCPGGRRHFYEVDDGALDGREAFEARYAGDPTCCFTAEGLALHRQIQAAYKRECP